MADRSGADVVLLGQPAAVSSRCCFYGRTPELKHNLKTAAGKAAGAYDDAMSSASRYLQRLSTPWGRSSAVRRLNVNILGMSLQLQFERCWAQLQQAMAMDRTDIDQALLAGKIIRELEDQHLLEDSQTPRRDAGAVAADGGDRQQAADGLGRGGAVSEADGADAEVGRQRHSDSVWSGCGSRCRSNAAGC